MRILPHHPLIGHEPSIASWEGLSWSHLQKPCPAPLIMGISGASNTKKLHVVNFLAGQKSKSKFCFEVEVPSMADIRFQTFPISWCRVGCTSRSVALQVFHRRWFAEFLTFQMLLQHKFYIAGGLLNFLLFRCSGFCANEKLGTSTKQKFFETLDSENKIWQDPYIYISYIPYAPWDWNIYIIYLHEWLKCMQQIAGKYSIHGASRRGWQRNPMGVFIDQAFSNLAARASDILSCLMVKSCKNWDLPSPRKSIQDIWHPSLDEQFAPETLGLVQMSFLLGPLAYFQGLLLLVLGRVYFIYIPRCTYMCLA